MSARIISFANQKGGSGKTTLCMQLAGSLANRGRDTLVLDADPQGTALRWAQSSARPGGFPATVLSTATPGASVTEELHALRFRHEFVLVDCPPALDSEVPYSAIMSSDLVIVPIIPSPTDLWAAVGIRQMIERISDSRPGLHARLVANMCQSNTFVNREIMEVLKEFGIIKFDSNIYLRTAYRLSALYGSSVHLMDDRALKARAEVDRLTDEVMQILR